MGESELSPFGPDGLSLLHKGWSSFKSIEFESLLEEVEEALLFKENGNMVSGVAVMDSENLLNVDITEESDLVRGRFLKRLLAAAGNLYGSSVNKLVIAGGSCCADIPDWGISQRTLHP